MSEAVLVIDVQIGLIGGAYRESETVAAINKVIGKVRARGGKVIFVQHCHDTFKPMMKGEPTWELCPDLDRADEDIVVHKTASDSFYKTNLDALLQEFRISRVMVTGLQSEYCVDTTCRSALSKGYDVLLISDAHTTGDSHMKAQAVIDHHNQVLANLAHPDHQVKVIGADEL